VYFIDFFSAVYSRGLFARRFQISYSRIEETVKQFNFGLSPYSDDGWDASLTA
jgi:hypothetical protein